MLEVDSKTYFYQCCIHRAIYLSISIDRFLYDMGLTNPSICDGFVLYIGI